MRFRERTSFTTALGGVTLGLAFSAAVLPVGTTNAAYSDFAVVPSTVAAGVWAPGAPAASDDVPPADGATGIPGAVMDDGSVAPPAPESAGSSTGTHGGETASPDPTPAAVPDGGGAVIAEVPGEVRSEQEVAPEFSSGPGPASVDELPAEPVATDAQP